MIFEADTEGSGQLTLEDWLLTLRSLHDDELLNQETQNEPVAMIQQRSNANDFSSRGSP